MEPYIRIWKTWYQGYVKAFHDYRVWNGKQNLEIRKKSLNLAKSVCVDVADLLFNEKCEITVDDPMINDYIVTVMDKNNMYVKLNEYQERKAAYGTVAYIPYWTSKGVKLNYVTAEKIVPLSWENGIVNELCVYSIFTYKNKDYFFTQLFYLNEDGFYVIENLLLEETTTTCVEVDYSEIPGLKDIEPLIDTASVIKPFIVDRLNIANNIDDESPFGISVFANAIDTIMACDNIFDSWDNEFALGKKRIMVAPEAMNVETGLPVFDANDAVFYLLPESISPEGKPFVQEIDMKLRVKEHAEALQNMLNLFSSQCGLGENYYRFDNGVLTTATQVISDNSKAFRRLRKHEIILEDVLVDLYRAIISVASRRGDLPFMSDDEIYDEEIIVKFDDSIIEDTETEVRRNMAEVSAGLLSPERYIMWRRGVPEDQVDEWLPRMGIGQKEEGMQ